MKPSKEILKEYEKIKSNMDSPIEDLHKCITAIMRFLDEEHEKNKPCEHKDSYQPEVSPICEPYNVCNDCGVLFLAAPDENKKTF